MIPGLLYRSRWGVQIKLNLVEDIKDEKIFV